MGFSEDAILQWFAQYAYQPGFVYSAIVLLMVASSFGLPAPEEITLLSAGLVCYMGSRPDLFPPPNANLEPVNVYVTASVCLASVFLSDFLVFSLGRYFGDRILKTRFIAKQSQKIEKVSKWTKKHGAWAAGVFRFTPGLRFPGHFSCGMLGLSPIKFTAVDGTAALLSVPTQVMLLAFYGESILKYVRQFKIVILCLGGVILAFYLVKKFRLKGKLQNPPASSR